LKADASLPSNLSGKLAISDLLPPTYNYEISVVDLDGSNRKSLGFGSAPSLSPDGTRVVHEGPMIDGPSKGLFITDLASAITTPLPGTATGDMGPLWSPDGQRIAFTRRPASGLIGAPGPYNIVMMNVDGSDVRQLTQGESAKTLASWMQDDIGILYTEPSRDSISLHLMNTETGENRVLFETNYNGTFAISPDAKRLAFEEMLPLDKYGLFLSDFDGSNRKLLADGISYTVTIPAWSPDGQWVIASVHDQNASNEFNARLALIQVDTCQIIALPKGLVGYVSSWLP
jgi:Tol biopolymer transport system component